MQIGNRKHNEPLKIKYSFSAKLWKDKGQGGWYFISVPKDLSKEIRENLQWQEEGWGRMKAQAIINETEWSTAIWFDTKMQTYLLPVKSEIRKKAGLTVDEVITVSLSI